MATTFADELNGITSEEVGGLIDYVRQPQNLKYSSERNGKTVRRYSAAPLGVEVNITEVFTGYSCTDIIPNLIMKAYGRSSFSVETLEWEFTVTTDVLDLVSVFGPRCWGKAKIGDNKLALVLGEFEGCRETYKHEMTMLRLAIDNDVLING